MRRSLLEPAAHPLSEQTLADALATMAARERDRESHATAAAALELASALTTDPATRARRCHSAAAAARLAGQRERSRSLRDAAGELDDSMLADPSFALHLARTELFTGDPATSGAIVGRATDTYPVDPVSRAELLVAGAAAALLAGDPVRASTATAAAGTLVADRNGRLAITTDVVRGLALLESDQPAAGATLLHRGAAALDGVEPGPEYVILAALGLSRLGAPRASDALLTPLIDKARSAGAIGLLPFALFAGAHAAIRAGKVRSAQRLASEAVDLADQVTDGYWRYRARGVLAYVHAILGEETACLHHASDAAAMALTRPGKGWSLDASDALGHLEAGMRRHDEAIVAWRTAGPGLERTAELVEARIRAGQPDAPMPAAVGEWLAGAAALPLQAAVAWRLHGMVAPDSEVERHFERAIALHHEVDAPLDLGRTRLAYGERLRRMGRRVRARTELRAARDAFDRADASPWAQRARDELLACGGPTRGGPAGDGVTGLTPQEFQTARAVATGATNREAAARLYLSVKTVEFHLTNIYRKLGVRTRTELAHRFPTLAGTYPGR